MTKYDKELDTSREEYEEAVKPLTKDEDRKTTEKDQSETEADRPSENQ